MERRMIRKRNKEKNNGNTKIKSRLIIGNKNGVKLLGYKIERGIIGNKNKENISW